MKNTRDRAVFTLFIYRTKKQFVGVCLELDIVDNGSDSQELEKRMKKSIESYVKRVCSDSRFNDSFLNRRAPKKYWKIFFKYLENIRLSEELSFSESNQSSPTSVRKRTPISNDFFFLRQNIQTVCPA